MSCYKAVYDFSAPDRNGRTYSSEVIEKAFKGAIVPVYDSYGSWQEGNMSKALGSAATVRVEGTSVEMEIFVLSYHTGLIAKDPAVRALPAFAGVIDENKQALNLTLEAVVLDNNPAIPATLEKAEEVNENA